MLQPTLLNQISNIYYIADDSYPITYRYVSMREATNLFDKHQLYFTNTSSWAKNATPDSGDPLETAFENWKKADYNNVKTIQEEMQRQVDEFLKDK